MKEKNKENLVKRILKRKKLLVFIVILLLIAGFAYRSISSKNKKALSEPAEVKRGTVTEDLVLSGEIDAQEYAALTYPVSGKVAWVGVKEGDTVKRGQALGKLDTTSLNAAYQQALSSLRAAEANVAYVHDQVKDHSEDETYYQKTTRTAAEVTKDQAYESVKIAQENLRNATAYSPFAGIVTSVTAPYAGISVLMTQTQFEVINPSTLFFEVTADQTEVVNISQGQQVVITLDAYPEEEFKGNVVFVSYTPRSGDVGTSYKIKIEFDKNVNLDLKKFRMGMGGDVKFVLKEANDVLFLPPKYIKTDSKGNYVNLERKNNKTYIETGLEGEDKVEIKSGLEEGQLVFD